MSGKFGTRVTKALEVEHPAFTTLSSRSFTTGNQVLVTGGAAGRFNPIISRAIEVNNPVLTSSSKERNDSVLLTASDSVESIMDKINGVSCIVHAACAGDNIEANTNLTKKILAAADKLEIPVVIISSSASQISGLSAEKTAYAYGKKIIEEEARQYGATVARVGMLVGDEKEAVISLCHMAGPNFGNWPSVSIRPPDRTIQPIDYDSAAEGIAKIVERILAGEKVDEAIDIVGDPISLHEFLDKINDSAIPVHVELDDLEKMASLVNNGAFTPEFIELARQGCEVVNNEKLKEMLGAGFKTVDEVADRARAENRLSKINAIFQRLMANTSTKEKRNLLSESLNLIRTSKPGESRTREA